VRITQVVLGVSDEKQSAVFGDLGNRPEVSITSAEHTGIPSGLDVDSAPLLSRFWVSREMLLPNRVTDFCYLFAEEHQVR
jgi:hypothetical protein